MRNRETNAGRAHPIHGAGPIFIKLEGKPPLARPGLNLSSAKAATTPTTRQTMLATAVPTPWVKLPKGMMTKVAAMTMPTMAWKAQL